MNELSWRIKRIVRFVDDHYLDSSLSLEMVADHFAITPQYLSGLFKKTINQNFTSYITLRRIDQAKKLMSSSKMNLSEIATRSGFSNYLSLSRAFQKYESQTPGSYRKTHSEKSVCYVK